MVSIKGVTSSTINYAQDTISDVGKFSFQQGNAKVGLEVWVFNIPAGHTCPGAMLCESRTGILPPFDHRFVLDGRSTQFRCFAASEEARNTSAFVSRWRNRLSVMHYLRNGGPVMLAAHLNDSLPKRAKKVRAHASGDFFNANYFKAWMILAAARPDVLFYAYTKSLNVWADYQHDVPPNFVLTASRGGKYDRLIDDLDLREAVVVFHPEQAEKMGLKIDHDDSLAMDPSVKKFGLLLHGGQPAGSAAAEALRRMKREGVKFSYSNESNRKSQDQRRQRQ